MDDVEVEVLEVVEVVLLEELVVTSAAVVGAEVVVPPVLLSSLHEPTTKVRAATAKTTVRDELMTQSALSRPRTAPSTTAMVQTAAPASLWAGSSISGTFTSLRFRFDGEFGIEVM